MTIDAGERFVVSGNLNFGEVVRIEYQITEGDADLDFYIINSDDDVVENLGDVIGYGLYHFYVPYDDYFGIVFRNDRLLSHRHLQLNLDIIVQKTITIGLPSSISTFISGYNYIIWTSTGDIQYVQIELYKNGIFLEVITSWTNNDGSYSWYIYDDDYVDSSYYQIKIKDYSDNTIYDYSSYFTIECEPELKTITITSPTNTDTLLPGSNYITWTSTGDIDYVCIDLYKDGTFLETISSYTSNDGSYTWYISSSEHIDGTNYKIKISDYYDNTIYDYSDYFTIEIDEDYVDPYDTEPDNFFLGWLIFIILPAIAIIIPVAIILIRRHKRKSLGEPI